MTRANSTEIKKRLDRAAAGFYRAGVEYIAALDAWIDAEAIDAKRVRAASAGGGETSISRANPAIYLEADLSTSREFRQDTEEFLRRIFPDEFADTSSAAE